MKRIEYSDVIEACKTAIQQLADEQSSFSKSEVVDRVMAAHPEFDTARVKRAAAKCLQALDRHPTVEQDEADLKETIRHAEALMADGCGDEAEAYLAKKMGERQRAIESRAWEIYTMQIGTRVLGRQGDLNIYEMVKRLGSEAAYIEAVMEELRLDQTDPDAVSTPSFDRGTVTCTTEQFLHWFRVEARRILTDEKPRLTFHFPTGPEEAA